MHAGVHALHHATRKLLLHLHLHHLLLLLHHLLLHHGVLLLALLLLLLLQLLLLRKLLLVLLLVGGSGRLLHRPKLLRRRRRVLLLPLLPTQHRVGAARTLRTAGQLPRRGPLMAALRSLLHSLLRMFLAIGSSVHAAVLLRRAPCIAGGAGGGAHVAARAGLRVLAGLGVGGGVGMRRQLLSWRHRGVTWRRPGS